jgi:hypothetical protein
VILIIDRENEFYSSLHKPGQETETIKDEILNRTCTVVDSPENT